MSQEGTAPANNPTVPVVTPELSLDALIDQKFSSPEFQSQTPHTNINFASVIDALPEDARKLVHNLREDYRKKTTELSQKTKELQSREQSLLSKDTHERLAALSNLPEDVDLYNPDGLAKYIEAQAAKQLQSLLEPARQAQALESRKSQLDTFRAQNPDFETYKSGIVELIESGTVSNAEDGYYLLKGRAARAEAEVSQRELEAYKKAAREAGMKVSTGSNAQNVTPKFTNAYDAYQWRKNNPGK